MNIDDQINREIGVHGQSWNALHDGYFGDSLTAGPFVATIVRYLSVSRADIVVDLGGGTGFVLNELSSLCKALDIMPVNLDCSPEQLDAVEGGCIKRINRFISEFTRNDLSTGDRRLFFIMRSVFHYLGKEGLNPALSHIRLQAEAGEMFIHQTACFENTPEAQCMNALYQLMETRKWYPTIRELQDSMIATGWQVVEMISAPSLKLSSTALGERYGLDAESLATIRGHMQRDFGNMESIFHCGREGFIAYLPYRICVTRAV